MLDIQYYNFPTSENANIAKIAKQMAESIKSEDSFYKIFSVNHAKAQASDCKEHAAHIRKSFSDIIVIGMGGASLNPQSVVSLMPNKNGPKIHFANNTDPIFLENLLANIKLETCAIIAISNSGQTLETNALVGLMLKQFQDSALPNIGNHFYFVTKPKSGTLSALGSKIQATMIGHTDQISGRYSGLTNVTTFIAQIAGINVDDYISGAEEVINDFIKNKEQSQAAKAASAIYGAEKNISANLGYLQNFVPYLEWYCQIIAESIGKDGKGITPIRGLGPNDQHSMLQLYLDGPEDKIYNLFYTSNIKTDLDTAALPELGYMAGKNMEQINRANFDATLAALKSKNLPVRTVIMNELSAKSVGELVAHSMLETIMLCHLFNVNPFDQPAVELIKTESKKLVERMV